MNEVWWFEMAADDDGFLAAVEESDQGTLLGRSPSRLPRWVPGEVAGLSCAWGKVCIEELVQRWVKVLQWLSEVGVLGLEADGALGVVGEPCDRTVSCLALVACAACLPACLPVGRSVGLFSGALLAG